MCAVIELVYGKILSLIEEQIIICKYTHLLSTVCEVLELYANCVKIGSGIQKITTQPVHLVQVKRK